MDAIAYIGKHIKWISLRFCFFTFRVKLKGRT